LINLLFLDFAWERADPSGLTNPVPISNSLFDGLASGWPWGRGALLGSRAARDGLKSGARKTTDWYPRIPHCAVMHRKASAQQARLVNKH
jgi:hypothetical protein